MEKKNIHKDHRQRVRSRYLAEGINSMADHNIIELLLFYAIPVKNTNRIAHDLVEKFNDINGILEASVEELKEIEGIGENAAVFLKLIRDISLLYSFRKHQMVLETSPMASLKDFVELQYTNERTEKVYVLCLDSQGRVKRCVKVCDGSPDSVIVDTRTIIETVVRFDTKNIVLMHNHPNGFAVPSAADIKTTKELKTVLSALEINFADHIIYADGDTFSMAESNKFKELFK